MTIDTQTLEKNYKNLLHSLIPCVIMELQTKHMEETC